MTQPGDKFDPRTVDEQIEQFARRSDQSEQSQTARARLIRHLRLLYQDEAIERRQRALARAWERIRQNEAQPQQERNRLRRQPQHKGDVPMASKRIQGLAAVFTIAVVTVLFVLLLRALLPSHPGASPASSGTPQATASQTPTTPPGPAGQWVTIPGLTNIQQASPMIAPSNPQVDYEDLTPAGTTQFSLRRSDDAGATWHALEKPAGLPSTYDETSVVVSPLDPMTVILTLTIYSGAHPDLCAPSSPGNALLASRPESGGSSCGMQFYSADGGMRWSRLQLPIAGAIGAPFNSSLQNPTSAEVLRPQGQRLYSAISPYSTVDNVTFGGAGVRILASDDGGKTWQLVDAGIQASGEHTCDFLPTTSGSTIFAIAQSGSCYDTQTPSPAFFWRSDDSGTHWTQVSQLLGTANNIVLVSRGIEVDPLIYIHTPVYVPAAGPDAQTAVSEDGGKTWQNAPTAGVPDPSTDGSNLSPYGPFAALSDGSVVNIFPTGNTTMVFAAWKAGEQSWQRVAPDLVNTRSLLSFFVTSSAGGKESFWLITQDGSGSTSVLRYDQQ